MPDPITNDPLSDLESRVRDDILPLADLLEEAFSRAASSIEQELAQVAQSGSLSMKAMIDEILNDLARLATDQLVRQPLEAALLTILGGSGPAGNDPGVVRSGAQTAGDIANALTRAGRNR